ncbi:hypothetical protein SmJEL517_g02836 [Synchytrium microbalum]|uniref:Uncharacterized protein n=1 Tax=Synchytrium microbalum TaxID=1806994 RepID=A0A507C997_9FUNG|nr:uncharacterized protein SmJEL517_g02836 [Synchytrium microbalum]TPX34544.1 hypothetical protein SmJEL517_g02836 [Synchytrium microbalum]
MSSSQGGGGKKRPHDGPVQGSSNSGNRPNKRAKQEMQVQPSSSNRNQSGSAMAGAPRNIDVTAFAESRAFEIRTMEQALSNATEFTGKQRVYQTLPRHMRRRAASHNVKRLPRRVQQRAKAVEANEAPRKERKPSKRRKKIVKSRQDEYKRRQVTKRWLETHIWHAKRMKMIEIWGYRLAEHPNDKSLRSAFRAGNTQCVIHDASYTGTIELSGSLTNIKALLLHLIDPSTVPVSSARYTSGIRSGDSFLHRVDQYPFGALCPVKFLWKPDTNANEATLRTLWLFVHPSAFNDALEEVTIAVSHAEGIAVKRLDTELVRFELSGPRSHAILQQVLKIPLDLNQSASVLLWNDLLHLRTPVSLPPSVVVGLAVDDPRLSFPPRMPSRTDMVPLSAQAKIESHLVNWPNNVPMSDIWDESIRQRVGTERASEADLNTRRSQNLIPGTRLKSTDQDALIPILLIQRSAAHQTQESVALQSSRGLADGWDVILPKEWGHAFWKSFIFAGARAGGLRERHNAHFESGLPHFPYEYPETHAGRSYSMGIQLKEQGKWSRRPPAKRVNYSKLKVPSPFRAPFETLVKSPFGKASSLKKNAVVIEKEEEQDVAEAVLEEVDAAIMMGMGMEVDLNAALNSDDDNSVQEDDEMVEDEAFEGDDKREVTNDVEEMVKDDDTEELPVEEIFDIQDESPLPFWIPSSKPLLRKIQTALASSPTLEALETELSNAITTFRTSRNLSPIPPPLRVSSILQTPPLLLDSMLVRVRIDMMGQGHPVDNAILFMASQEDYTFWMNEAKKQDWEKQLLGGSGGRVDMIPSDAAIAGYIITAHFSLSQAKGMGLGCCTMKSLWQIKQDVKK